MSASDQPKNLLLILVQSQRPPLTEALLIEDNGLGLFAKFGYPEPHDITWLQENGRILRSSDTARSASKDDITRLQSHETADITNQECWIKDQMLGIGALLIFAIYLKPNIKIACIKIVINE